MSDTKTKWQPNDEQRAILLALQAECAKESSVAWFARKFLPFTRSKYDQIMDVFSADRSQSYFDQINPSAIPRLMDELSGVLEEIPLKRNQLARIDSFKIHATTKLLALEQAIKDVKTKPGPERLIVNLGPTGGGKTIACNYLAKKVHARFVEVRDIWRHSTRGKVPLDDICRGVGMRSWSGLIAKAQDQLIEFCGDQNIVIVFDEGEHFGPTALNLLKLLLNKTRMIPVIFAVPEKYDAWAQLWPNEAAQIARRTHAIIDSTVLDERDVAMFFPGVVVEVVVHPDQTRELTYRKEGDRPQFAKPEEAIVLIKNECSRFGHYSLVRRVAEILDGLVNVPTKEVGEAIKKARRQMIRPTNGN